MSSKYTEGGEFILRSTNQDYIGFYIENNGEVFAGKKYQFGISKRLIKSKEVNTINTYNKISHSKIPNLTYANETVVSPTNKQYKDGTFKRYFCMIRNTKEILEIDKKGFDSIQGTNYYKTVSIDWKLTGPKRDVMQGSIMVEAGVYDTNKKTVKKISLSDFQLDTKINDYLQFYKEN